MAGAAASAESIVAYEDASLDAFVVARRPLRYARGADPSEDRPAHVRAASALVRFAGELVVVQDDAHFLARLDLEGGAVQDLPLARGPGGARLFDELRGNKAHKLDLEAAAVVRDGDEEVLLVLGSGSSPARETVIAVRREGERFEVRQLPAPALYASLREARGFSGSELNLEGAVCLGDDLVLFQRGNGAARAGQAALDASGRLDARALLAHLRGEGPCPPLRDVRRYQLGAVGGARLSFTDATVIDGVLHYVAAAEASPDAISDGPVAGVALGVIDERGAARHGVLRERDGEPCVCKVEGVAGAGAGRLLGVVDADDPERAAELLEIAWAR